MSPLSQESLSGICMCPVHIHVKSEGKSGSEKGGWATVIKAFSHFLLSCLSLCVDGWWESFLFALLLLVYILLDMKSALITKFNLVLSQDFFLLLLKYRKSPGSTCQVSTRDILESTHTQGTSGDAHKHRNSCFQGEGIPWKLETFPREFLFHSCTRQRRDDQREDSCCDKSVLDQSENRSPEHLDLSTGNTHRSSCGTPGWEPVNNTVT